jgi:hypothetical protein
MRTRRHGENGQNGQNGQNFFCREKNLREEKMGVWSHVKFLFCLGICMVSREEHKKNPVWTLRDGDRTLERQSRLD